jgi:hypothetical protein
MNTPISLKGRAVDRRSINISGVERQDYPDFCDAYISEAQWANEGTALNDEELEQLTQEQSQLVNDLSQQIFIAA